MNRLERLQAGLEEPLLVSSPVNIRYLTGLASSNAALLVEPGRVRVFTDFRYAERARAIEGVELVQTRRDIYAELPELLAGRIAFEPNPLTYERYALLHAGHIELVPRRGLVEGGVRRGEEPEATGCEQDGAKRCRFHEGFLVKAVDSA